MNIEQMYTMGGVDELLTNMEVALKIGGKDYGELSYDVILRNVKERINREYQIDLSLCKVNDISFETGIYQTAVALFLDNMAGIHAKLNSYCQIARYNTHVDISLLSINYMSFTEDSLKVTLKLLQRSKTIPSCDEAIEAIKRKIMTIKMSREKRFFMLLLICYDFGLYEIVATIAEILYLGGVL